jgi:uncharacterized protein (DUF58 family)
MQNRRNAIYALLIIFLAAGLFTGRAFFFNLVYLLGGLMAISLLWAWLSVQWISVSRKTRSTRAQVGGVIEESFTVFNRSIIPRLWLDVRDLSTLAGHRAGHVVPAMGARAAYSWRTETPCEVRGEFQLGPMVFASGDPFGLFVYQRRINATSRVIVYPATVRLERFALPPGILSGGDAQRQRTHVITTNAAGVRDYAYGDSMNRIHWKTSARRDQLMVKEFELDPLVDIWLMIDFAAAALFEDPAVQRVNGIGPVIPVSATIPPSTEEYAVVAGASLAEHFSASERAVGFIAYCPQRVVYQPERGPRQWGRIMTTLATARSLSPYSLAQALTLELPHIGRGVTLLLITASTDRSWVAMAQVLASKGIKPVAVLIDAASFGGPAGMEQTQALLHNARIPALTIRKHDDIGRALAGAG